MLLSNVRKQGIFLCMRNRFACGNTSYQRTGTPAQYSGFNEACLAKIWSNIEKKRVQFCAYCNIPMSRYSIRFMRSISDYRQNRQNFLLYSNLWQFLLIYNSFLNISFPKSASPIHVIYSNKFLQCAPSLCIFRLIQRTRQWIFSFLWAVFALLCIQLIFYMDKYCCSSSVFLLSHIPPHRRTIKSKDD
jgi:hypothetical protein